MLAGDVYGATGLVWAINQANVDGVVSEICLTNSTYSLTSASSGLTGLPIITGQMEIIGNGATIERGGSAPEIRLIEVASGANVIISNTILTGGNLSTGNGGAIFNFNGNVTLQDSTVSNNQAQSGAGIYNDSGTLIVTNTSVTNNVATGGSGGGIVNVGASATLTLNSAIINSNMASSGGGVFNSDGIVNIDASTISFNSADSAGGVYNNNFGQVVINNSTMASNYSQAYGGAISTNGAIMTINNSCVTSNTSPIGSGITNLDSGATPVNAEYNWWGSADGPSGVGSGSGDAVYGNVDFDPFLTAISPTCP